MALLPLWLIAVTGWIYASAIYLPWWWSRIKGERIKLSRADIAKIGIGYGVFILVIFVVMELPA